MGIKGMESSAKQLLNEGIDWNLNAAYTQNNYNKFTLFLAQFTTFNKYKTITRVQT